MEIEDTVEMVEGVIAKLTGGCSGDNKGVTVSALLPSWKTGLVMKERKP